MNLIRIDKLTSVISVSRSTIYRWIAQGTFPEPIKIGERASGWLANEIDDFIKNKIKERTHETKN